MKFWPMYGERWTAKTSHLSPMREGLYLRLIVWTMTHERPLPPALKDCCAIARINNGQQAYAVKDILAEFFELQGDGWHQKTADEVLDWWRSSGYTASVTRRSGTQVRMSAYRSRLGEMRNALGEKGVKTHSRMGATQLQQLCEEHGVTGCVTRNDETRDAKRDAMRYAYIQNPVTQSRTSRATVGALDAPKPAPAGPIDDDRPGPLALAMRALHGAGMTDAYPGHPLFVELVSAGVDAATFKRTALEARNRGKGFGWAMAAIKGRLEDASNGPPKAANGAPSVDPAFAEGLLTPEGRERLERAIADPAVADPWELPPISAPPSPSKRDSS